MAETVLNIKHWGNRLGVRLPAAVARAARLYADQRVRINVDYVLCHQPKSFYWRQRGRAPHPMKRIPDVRFAEVLTILNRIVQLA